MEQSAWDELEAQVEDHGYEAVEFYLDQLDEATGENMELYVLNISYEDDKIKVTLG